MFTIETCRRLLGDSADGLSDGEVKELRDQLADLAHLAIDEYYEHRERYTSAIESWSGLTEEERYVLQERAAILESDAGFSRQDALRLAWSQSSGGVN